MRSSSFLRRGFTLIELLVVIGILAFLAALTALFFPRFQERQQVETGSASLSSYLLTAKTMAKRDGVPTGLRISVVANVAGGSITQCQYIQQPDDFAQGVYVGWGIDPTDPRRQPQSWIAKISGAGQALTQIQSGDYLEVYGGGVPHRITGTSKSIPTLQYPDQIKLDPGSTPLPNITAPSTNTSLTNYRIIPQARLIQGEQTYTLPTDVIVDFGSFTTSTGQPRPKTKLPTNPAGGATFSEILFAPSGAVIGSGAANPGYYYIYVRDNGQDTLRKIGQGKVFEGNPRLIAIYPRTGFIATHPVNPNVDNHDLYLKDGRSSGM
jgi:prepilin-type N-terminal cleavage/methylation domain-containing protein